MSPNLLLGGTPPSALHCLYWPGGKNFHQEGDLSHYLMRKCLIQNCCPINLAYIFFIHPRYPKQIRAIPNVSARISRNWSRILHPRTRWFWLVNIVYCILHIAYCTRILHIEYCTRGPDDFDWWVKFDQFPQIKAHTFASYLDFSQFWFDGYYKKKKLGKTYGEKIVEAARSDISTVQKHKFGLFRSLLCSEFGTIPSGGWLWL